ncbi:hypothetical protein HMY34_16980 [Thiothrix subterranea]|uniref:hypothetical protein n=1 Tax=Thiothrix subterranea TaxID=2735563 RepID=UPI00192BC92E|nr:hypothetical protein [Thiothrix subterranea]QQZ30313.1 hypothetical protein HMY34_16980 [Thiothrix subterranea]
MFHFVDERATSLQPLFTDDLQTVCDDFFAFVDAHGLVYNYSPFKVGKPPKGLHIAMYRTEYDRILSRLNKSPDTLAVLQRVANDLQSHIERLDNSITDQSRILAESNDWLTTIDDDYSQAVMFADDDKLYEIEVAIKDKQDLMQRLTIKKAGLEKARQKIANIKAIVSAMAAWLSHQLALDAALTAEQAFNEKLAQFAQDLHEFRGVANRVRMYTDGGIVMKVVNALGMAKHLYGHQQWMISERY